MKMLEKILVATDFVKSQTETLQAAVTLAKTFRSQVFLIHVIPEIQALPHAVEDLRNAARARLQKLQAEISGQGVRVADSIIAVGSPFYHIIQLADFLDVNVIVAGSGEKSAEDRFRLGLTADKLIRKANKPVWVVKPGARAVVRKILCPVDFSDPSRRALTNSIHLARSFEAELRVLTVIQSLAAIYASSATLAAEAQTKIAEQQEVQFDEFLKTFDFHKVSWTKMVRAGLPHQEILAVAREQDVDLLVMGSVGQTALARILMGSVAEKVIREMPSSVLTVKSEHAIRLRLEEEIADLDARMARGKELLEAGFPMEALREFEYCLGKELMYPRAWQGLAAAHKRLGHEDESEQCLERAEYFRGKLVQPLIEAEARAQHPLFGKNR